MKKTTLVIEDEVNCLFKDLPVDIRSIYYQKYKMEIPGMRFTPAVKLGRWDGKHPFFGLNGSAYVNMLPEILEDLINRGYDPEIDDQRTYNTDFSFDAVDENSYSHITWPKGHIMESQPIILRDYQVTAINDYLGNTQCIQTISTGAGKTIITGILSHKIEKYGRSIVIVPSTTLVEQTEEDYINLGLDVGVYFGERKELNHKHTICTWQSLEVLFKKSKDAKKEQLTLTKFLIGVVGVIIDETHGAKAESLRNLLLNSMGHIPIRWGLTGTMPKDVYNLMSIKIAIGEVIGTIRAIDLQEAGVLAKCHVNIMQLLDHVDYKNYQQELKYLVTDQDRIAYLAKIINEIPTEGNSLILVDRVSIGEYLAANIPNSVFVYGETKGKDRRSEFKEMATSTNKRIISTYGVAAVGINIPRIFNLILIEPGKSFVRVIQSVGRALRMANDKDFANIWDICSNCKFSKKHLTERKKYYKEAGYPFTIKKIDWK